MQKTTEEPKSPGYDHDLVAATGVPSPSSQVRLAPANRASAQLDLRRIAQVIVSARELDHEIIEVVAAWAGARGLWRATAPGVAGLWEAELGADDLVVVRRGDPARKQLWRRIVSSSKKSPFSHDLDWRVEPVVALAWALALEVGGDATLDVGPCPACHGEGSRRVPDQGRSTFSFSSGDAITYTACPACDGTGRERRGLAVAVLDACPRASELARLARFVSAADLGCLDALAVHADALQAAGDPLGDVLAHYLTRWLHGHREGVTEAVALLRARGRGISAVALLRACTAEREAKREAAVRAEIEAGGERQPGWPE